MQEVCGPLALAKPMKENGLPRQDVKINFFRGAIFAAVLILKIENPQRHSVTPQ